MAKVVLLLISNENGTPHQIVATMKTFTYNIIIKTTAPKLWEALTSKDFSREYWSEHEIRSEWKVGSTVALVQKDGTVNWEGKILFYDPPTYLSYTIDVSIDQRFH